MDPFDLRLWHSSKTLPDPFIIDQVCIDTRQISSPHALFVALQGCKDNGHHYLEQAQAAGAKAAIVQKDYQHNLNIENMTLFHVDDPLVALQEIAIKYRQQFNAKIIAITGTHGKTMVKDLLQTMLSIDKNVAASPGSYNSQIGVPLSLFTITKNTEIALIEAAVSKKGEMDKLTKLIEPNACILTHLGKKHLATMGDLKTLTTETLKLLTFPGKEKWVLMPHAPLTLPHVDLIDSTRHFWNMDTSHLPHAISLSNPYNSVMKYSIKFPDNQLYEGAVTSGFYYFLDLINITTKAAWLLGLSSEKIMHVIKNYIVEPIRTEIWKSPIGTIFINDAYCSDSQSVSRSLKQYEHAPADSRKLFIFGGMRDKEAKKEYKNVVSEIVKSKVQLLTLVGTNDYHEIKESLSLMSPQTEICHYPTYQDAFQQIRGRMKPNDYVLITGERKQSLDSLTEIVNDSISTNQCFINLAAIDSNIQMIRNKLKMGTRVMVIVKAFAYGTDEVRISKFLHTCGIDILGVSYVDEGIVLKRAGAKQAIFVINAPIYEVVKVVKWELEVGVSEKDFILVIASEAEKQNKKIKVHLHIDTGMSRLGCRPEDALKLAQCIKDCPSLILEGIMTHFASSDSPTDDEFTLKQAKVFDNAIQEIKDHGIRANWIHASNSSAVIRFNFPNYNMVRVGLAVYGLYCSDAAKKEMDLRLAISLVSRVVGLNNCKNGDSVSYGRSYRIERENQKIAVLPIGYFDGLHRNYSGKGYVIIRGQKAPMVGKICMDFMMVDVSEIQNVSIGDPVLIFGEDEYGQYLPPESLAMQGDSIVHELITCLGPRIQRVFVNEEGNKER